MSDDNHNSNDQSEQNKNNKSLNCRMYKEEYPKVDELVVVQVRSIVDMGAYCSLLEYNGIEGMILMSELSRRRIRSVNRLIRVGRQEIVAVLRVNEEKGYIDLSKKRVSAEDLITVEDRWNKSKAVHSILRHVAKHSKYGVQQLYELFVWELASKLDDHGNKQSAYEGLRYAFDNREEFLENFNVPEDIIDVLFANISKRMKQQQVTIRCPLECTCFQKQGILAIKKALKAGLNLSTDDFVIQIQLEAAPRYMLTLSTLKPKEGEERIMRAIEAIKNEISKHGGELVVKRQPKAMLK